MDWMSLSQRHHGDLHASSLLSLLLIIPLAVALSACGSDDVGGSECQTNADCPSGEQCAQGTCIAADDTGPSDTADVDGECTDEDDDGYYAEESCEGEVDCDDQDADINPGSSEVCDGVDNDCDGEVDEEFDDLGESCTAGMGACSNEGTYVCDDEGTGVTCDAEPEEPSEEVCDGTDNDCDGVVDNVDPDAGGDVENCGACGNDCTGQFDNASAACEMGGCAIGECDEHHFDLDGDPSNGCEYECEASVQGATASDDSICDGLDNDCDGEIDEDVTGTLNGETKSPGDSCTAGVGQCATEGTVVCANGDSSSGDTGTGADGGVDAGTDGGASGGIVCDATPGTPSPEICDDLDNDCDGEVDNGCDDDGDDYCDDEQMVVGTPAICPNGAGDCNDDESSANPGEEEQCDDGIDNDCDGVVDENCGCNFEGKSEGVCSNGQTDSQGDCTIAPAEYQNPEEGQCDNLDNDCDGVTDEGCTCTYDSDSDGDTSDEVGLCTESTIDDQGNCPQPEGYEQDETSCDSVDNDCDGTVDEGCNCNYLGTSTGVCGNSGTNPDGSCEKPPNYESDETSCDGLDNDCDGVVDENCACDYLGRETGVCGGGGTIDPNTGNCEPPSDYVSSESSPGDCDRKDNDCDGVVDEDCTCVHDPTENDGDERDSDGSHDDGVCQGQSVDPASGLCTEPSNFELEEQTCDGIDNDCDGEVDEGCDDDGDGYCDAFMDVVGDPAVCPNSPTDTADDCADGTPDSDQSELDWMELTFPGAADRDSSTKCMKDVDGDGRGDATPPGKDETKGIGDIAAGTDCNDSSADATPDNSGDVCDDLDNNCDGTVDEGCDDDGDGHCDASKTVVGDPSVCPNSPTDTADDCDDNDANISPSAAPNESSSGCYEDQDGDDWGDSDAPSGVDDGTDCNDSEAAANPGISSEETCDALDNDCDGTVDEDCNDDGDAFCDAGMTITSDTNACSDTSAGDCADGVPGNVAPWMDDTFPGAAPNDSGTACMKDADTDDYGDASPPARDESAGVYDISAGSDCDDGDSNVNDGATETCDQVDNDCDGIIDEQCPCTYDPTESRDIDTDGSHDFAICQNQTISSSDGTCGEPSNFETRVETTCDDIDNDCDGTVDNGCDDDGDDHCDADKVVSGDPQICPASPTDTADDCDDQDPDIFEGAPELCDGKDNDCDGDVDEGCDDDGDGHCDASKTVVGDPSVCPNSPTDTADDCDDTDANISPSAAPNEPNAGCYEDQDGDDWGDASAPTGVDDGSDCVDSSVDVSPTAAEEEDQSASTCFADQDDDGWGDESAPTGGDSGGDCDDANEDINPGVAETIGDEIDFNCDDEEICFEDADDDGFRTTNTVISSSDLDCQDSGEATESEPKGDCVDTDANINPDAAPNEPDQTDVCYEDQDGDDWANSSPTESSVDAGSDCDDSDSGINPDASEQCDSSTDFDCDGAPQCGDADCDGQTCSRSGSQCASGSSNNTCIEFFCSDGIDNDRPYQSNGEDGADCLDTHCSCPSGTTCADSGNDDSQTGADIGECIESSCGNGVDDDNDGLTDCADTDCDGKACGDATSATDAKCVSTVCTEQDCSDGIDNDGDGDTDCDDADCTGSSACST